MNNNAEKYKVSQYGADQLHVALRPANCCESPLLGVAMLYSGGQEWAFVWLAGACCVCNIAYIINDMQRWMSE